MPARLTANQFRLLRDIASVPGDTGPVLTSLLRSLHDLGLVRPCARWRAAGRTRYTLTAAGRRLLKAHGEPVEVVGLVFRSSRARSGPAAE